MYALLVVCLPLFIVFAGETLVSGAQAPPQTDAQEKSAADFLPESTALYVEVSRPRHLLNVVLDHPLRKQVEALDAYQQAYKQKGYLEFRAVVAVIEAKLGMKWRPALEVLVGQAALAYDARTKGACLLVKARNEETLHKAVDVFVELARQDARQKGKDDPIKEGQYRGIKARQIDKSRFVVRGKWLLITDNGDLGKSMLDRVLDGGDTLASNQRFQQARKTIRRNPAAWSYVDMATVRDTEDLLKNQKELREGKTDNVLAELLIGGLLSNLQKTPYASAALYVEANHVQLEALAPHDPAWTPETRVYFFGPQGKGAAPPLLTVKDSLGSISAYRDVSQMWLRAGDLFSEKVNDQLATAESGLSTLFSGKDFGEDILGAVTPQVQLIAARQEYEKGVPRPAIKLPSFALVSRLKEPEKMKRDFRRTFQSLIGFLNVVGAMNGQPQADLDNEKLDDAQIITATFAPEEDEKDSEEAKINFNFSPSVAFVENLFIVSSTKQLARKLVQSAPKAKPHDDSSAQDPDPANALGNVDVSAVRQVLEDNRSQLVSQNRLSEGNSKEEAEQAIGALLDIVGMVKSASFRFETDQQQLKAILKVDVH